jgi:hypothetical protein
MSSDQKSLKVKEAHGWVSYTLQSLYTMKLLPGSGEAVSQRPAPLSTEIYEAGSREKLLIFQKVWYALNNSDIIIHNCESPATTNLHIFVSLHCTSYADFF